MSVSLTAWVAQNTIGVAVGMSLRVKNQSDQNLIRYLIRKWVCWLLMNEHFSDYSNLFFLCIMSRNMTPCVREMDHWRVWLSMKN